MFETKSGVFLIAGLIFFGFSFVVMGVLPWTIYFGEPEKTIEQIAEAGMIHEFVDLRERFPEPFERYIGELNSETYGKALELGRDIYVAEGCWHCHSQFIRPVSRESRRWGPVSKPLEYQNVLQRPVLFGTRRVGPDLIREGGRHSNDWHVAHFYKPRQVVPTSVMPPYPWFFDDEGYPNERGMAIITYVQWLGSWLDIYPYYYDEGPEGHDAEKQSESASVDTPSASIPAEGQG